MARVLLCESQLSNSGLENCPASARPLLDIALSERNLIVLLSKLYTPHSKRCLRCCDVPAEFAHADITAELDEFHYAHPTREGAPAGPMHPIAELIHQAVRRLVDDAVNGDARLAALVLGADPRERKR
jgi:hypothetical protein